MQWFITDLFGPRVAPTSFFFIALGCLRERIESSAFSAAWATIDHRTFLAVIIFHIHSLWVTLIQWADDCERVPIYYLHVNDILRIDGAAPFSRSVASLDTTLSTWLDYIDARFPVGILNMANAFRDNIPEAWDHIFVGSEGDRPSTRAPRPSPSGRDRRTGDRNRSGSRAWAHNVFTKVESHYDASRSRNTDLLRALRPLPRIKMDSGEYREICFSFACKGCQCIPRDGPCPLLHMSTRDPDLINASHFSMTVIRDWLRKPEVKARVRMSDAARRLRCFA